MLIDDKVRLLSLIRAMQDVVIPAIPSDAQLAVEQAHLVCHHLNLMLAQSDYNYRLQLAELSHFARMLRELIACLPKTGKLSPDIDAAEKLMRGADPIAGLRVPDGSELSAVTKQLRETADHILQAALSAGGTPRQRASLIVMDYAKRQIERERVAVKSAGFDLDAASLPDLKDLT
jgi:hypothetical protein